MAETKTSSVSSFAVLWFTVQTTMYRMQNIIYVNFQYNTDNKQQKIIYVNFQYNTDNKNIDDSTSIPT